MATYSAFFSSGLLALHHCRAQTPAPSSPILTPASPGDPIEVDRRTPTPSRKWDINTQVTPNAAQLNVPAAEQPRLRKRRSSVTLGASSMNAIKSPIRNTGAAHHRGLMGAMSPGRSRSGSLSNGVAVQAVGNAGRKRSSSGTVNIRPRRTLLRRAPTAPPPTAPLPDIPSMEGRSPTLGHQSLEITMKQMTSPVVCVSADQKYVPRQPLASRSHTTRNNQTKATSPPRTAHFDAVYIINEEMKEN